jgi:hypothetical protein
MEILLWISTPMDICSLDNFKIISKHMLFTWTTDGCHYFVNGNKIPSQNYKDVIIFKNSDFAKDNNFVYRNGFDITKEFGLDAKSFDVDKFGDGFDKYGKLSYERRMKSKNR